MQAPRSSPPRSVSGGVDHGPHRSTTACPGSAAGSPRRAIADSRAAAVRAHSPGDDCCLRQLRMQWTARKTTHRCAGSPSNRPNATRPHRTATHRCGQSRERGPSCEQRTGCRHHSDDQERYLDRSQTEKQASSVGDAESARTVHWTSSVALLRCLTGVIRRSARLTIDRDLARGNRDRRRSGIGAATRGALRRGLGACLRPRRRLLTASCRGGVSDDPARRRPSSCRWGHDRLRRLVRSRHRRSRR